MSIPHRFVAGRYRPVSYPDGPITARCRFIKKPNWDIDVLLPNSWKLLGNSRDWELVQSMSPDDSSLPERNDIDVLGITQLIEVAR